MGEAEALPHADDSFDVPRAQRVVGHLRDAELACGRWRGVRQAGRWRPSGDFAEGMTLLRSYWEAAAEVDPTARHASTGRRPYARLPELTHLWEAADLEDVGRGRSRLR